MSKDETPSGNTIIMRTVHLIVKRALFGLVGIMVVVAICFSSTLPSSLRLVEQEDGTRVLAAKPVSGHSAAAHARRAQAAKGLQHKSSDTKATKSMDRKTAQTTSALAGCKDYAPANAAPVVIGKKNTAGRTYSNSQEKNLCNPENPRSR